MAAEEDPQRFGSKVSQVANEISVTLNLAADEKFPIPRLATIWSNEKWRGMVTMWCKTRVGKDTFSISAWEQMISCRTHEV